MNLLSDDQRRTLLRLARESLGAHLVAGHPAPQLPTDGAFGQQLGSFVTLRNKGELRGCLGWIEPRKPLAQQVVELARMAASQDHRFQKVQASELSDISIEISLLSPVRAVRDVSTLQVGRDGLIVSRDGKRGLLLPQVANERGWTVETFLEQTCLKAGLPRDAWPEASIEAFSCEVFSE